ncbi:hypothetical protein [Pseudoduganella albidiflava]|uniref:Uncharacterized protein n=1 Tax=Pseudoduganella albidiflava TaxID=321983 RepID=A0A411X327_9BURK|nr:hypothetical protein [Pseudoduganella albidiflava]QBI03308.1 hypothetical protein EYF70_22625 [Pseudoduganella albidiflava]GGY67843.1 hypothetical protein GCM10007387_57530 [Pseudoduganella albidiflava]
MSYSSWRIAFQCSEQAARAAYARVEELATEAARLRYQVAQLEGSLAHWKANHADMATRCQYLAQRKDLPVDRIPAYLAHAQRIADLTVENSYLTALLAGRVARRAA